jgi:pyridoxal phosphate enzyme (YggS family)
VRTEIIAAARSCQRNPNEIKLIAVSKTQPAGWVRQALAANQRDFGENYVQEWQEKSAAFSPGEIDWHFIGHLQGNKVKAVVGRVTLIHTLDRLELARKIADACTKLGVVQDCLIEVKLASEPTKYGCAAADAADLVRAIRGLPQIRLRGLMTIGSLTSDKSRVQAEFAELRRLRDSLNASASYPRPLTELSMGMSGDFGIAIAAGATMVRIGSAIFAPRP